MFVLRKSFSFEAAHRLVHHDGKCARLHGHSWKLTVELRGKELYDGGPKRSMLIDYGDITAIVKPFLDSFLDHHYLNETLQTDSPTSEFVAQWLHGQLKGRFPIKFLLAITIKETCTSSCRYDG